MMPSKTQMMAAGVTILVLAAINNVKALEPVKKFVAGDNGWF
jgi:hypothetical protein